MAETDPMTIDERRKYLHKVRLRFWVVQTKKECSRLWMKRRLSLACTVNLDSVVEGRTSPQTAHASAGKDVWPGSLVWMAQASASTQRIGGKRGHAGKIGTHQYLQACGGACLPRNTQLSALPIVKANQQQLRG